MDYEVRYRLLNMDSLFFDIPDLLTQFYVIACVSYLLNTLGFYKGYLLTLSAVVPFSALQWALYWQIQSTLAQWLRAHPSESTKIIKSDTGENIVNDPRELYTAPFSAGAASALASLATQPMDTLKTRLQVQAKRTTLSEIFKKLIAEKGVKGFMSGSFARILTLAPSAVLSMSAYEAIKRSSVRQGSG